MKYELSSVPNANPLSLTNSMKKCAKNGRAVLFFGGSSNGEPQNLDYIQEILNGWMMGLGIHVNDSWIGE
jgi:chloramphenicol 3-O-phosphotransferase